MNETQEPLSRFLEDAQERAALRHVAGSEAFPLKVEQGAEKVATPSFAHGEGALSTRLHVGADHGHHHGPRETPTREMPTSPLSWLDKSWRIGAGSLCLVPAIISWAFDNATFHIFDTVGIEFVTALFYNAALKPLNAVWRGYKMPQWSPGSEKAPYNGDGYPDSATTYAVENFRYGYYGGGRIKKTVSRVVYYGSIVDQTMRQGAMRVGAAIKDIWRPRKDDFPFPISSIEKSSVTLGALLRELPLEIRKRSPLRLAAMEKGCGGWAKKIRERKHCPAIADGELVGPYRESNPDLRLERALS